MCCKNTNAKETHFGACCSRPDLYGIIIPGKHGKLLATLYSAGGEGPHPAVLLLHGIPGCEQNLDLAQSLRRTDFSSVIFFYRGCWGSEGIFSFEGSFEDTKAVLDFVLNDTQYNFDKNHIFFIGHSLGCVNAARMIALCSQAKGGVFLAPCDLWRIYLLGLENDDYREHLNDLLEEGIPYIHGTDEKTLTSEIKDSAGRLSISSCLQAISEKSILWISSPDDEVVSEAEETYPYIKRMKQFSPSCFKWLRVSSDHYFSNMRSQLTEDIARFLLENTDHKKSHIDQIAFETQLRKLICQQLATITLPDVASYFHISVPYASDLIRQVTGKNFTALVLEERMKESEKLLKTSNVPISKVALLSGYQEPSYFMKVFKKYFGCTPSQYRENISLK